MKTVVTTWRNLFNQDLDLSPQVRFDAFGTEDWTTYTVDEISRIQAVTERLFMEAVNPVLRKYGLELNLSTGELLSEYPFDHDYGIGFSNLAEDLHKAASTIPNAEQVCNLAGVEFAPPF